VEMLQVVVLLALAAMVTVVLFTTQEAVDKWSKPLVGEVLGADQKPSGADTAIEIEPSSDSDMDDLVETTLRLTAGSNTVKDKNNDDATPSDNMITVTESGVFGVNGHKASLEMKLDWEEFMFGEGKNFTWEILKESGKKEVMYWQKQSGTFADGRTVVLNWERPSSVNFTISTSVFIVRVKDSSSKVNRMLKVRVNHMIF